MLQLVRRFRLVCWLLDGDSDGDGDQVSSVVHVERSTTK